MCARMHPTAYSMLDDRYRLAGTWIAQRGSEDDEAAPKDGPAAGAEHAPHDRLEPPVMSLPAKTRIGMRVLYCYARAYAQYATKDTPWSTSICATIIPSMPSNCWAKLFAVALKGRKAHAANLRVVCGSASGRTGGGARCVGGAGTRAPGRWRTGVDGNGTGSGSGGNTDAGLRILGMLENMGKLFY
ncbi:hypothetical protein CALVIDRAFT_531392 [Calocera viscosa TUFC12733]|uniref:Uncharacterized protein n=1 Tax=Calocera viscosa (strain TUFC12733) TaxID=1330018 RepID=A0A167GH83_CALVF|nr:hypothetical protein CALVIDRAFT_531392 [Calocera viscosa TUFC12733]